MRISIDADLCEANGVCIGMAPDVFDLSEREELQVLVGDISLHRRQELLEVVGSCPRAALKLVEE